MLWMKIFLLFYPLVLDDDPVSAKCIIYLQYMPKCEHESSHGCDIACHLPSVVRSGLTETSLLMSSS